MVEHSDQFEVVNGPEDGTHFPITRTPVDLGCDPGCGICIRLDQNVRRFHARVTVVSGGYRIRRKANAPIYVNGRRAGRIWSRIVRPGGIVRVGSTELGLYCAPEGLAKRSYGLPSESDVTWALRFLFSKLFLVVRVLWRFLRGLTGRFFWIALITVALLILIAYLRPDLFAQAKFHASKWWYWAYYHVIRFLRR